MLLPVAPRPPRLKGGTKPVGYGLRRPASRAARVLDVHLVRASLKIDLCSLLASLDRKGVIKYNTKICTDHRAGTAPVLTYEVFLLLEVLPGPQVPRGSMVEPYQLQ